jgi:putative peptidoglycan lipid II flippase
LATLVLVPATAGLLVLGGPIIGLLFEHGAFTASDSDRTLGALRFLSLGILGYGMTYLATRAFYALQDTKTPMVISSVAVGVNIGLDLILIGPLGVGGLALATAAAGTVQLAISLGVLARRLETPLAGTVGRDGAKMGLAAGVMGAAVHGVDAVLLSANLGDAVRTGVGLLVGLVSYGGLALLMPSTRSILRQSGLTMTEDAKAL